jgi:hypothetical protein
MLMVWRRHGSHPVATICATHVTPRGLYRAGIGRQLASDTRRRYQ